MRPNAPALKATNLFQYLLICLDLAPSLGVLVGVSRRGQGAGELRAPPHTDPAEAVVLPVGEDSSVGCAGGTPEPSLINGFWGLSCGYLLMVNLQGAMFC